jgi:hypothetical protein
LATLLIRRKRPAVRWAEEFSRQLPDADDIAYELAVTEQAIAHYASVYDAQFVSGWPTTPSRHRRCTAPRFLMYDLDVPHPA